MHQNKNIRNLLLKFVNNECSPQEKEEVLRYFQGKSYSRDMPEVEEVLEVLSKHFTLDEDIAENIYRKIVSHDPGKQIQEKTSLLVRRRFWRYAVAATFLLLVTAGLLYQAGYIFDDVTEVVLTEHSHPADLEHSTEITLQLANGHVEVIDPEGRRTVLDGNGNIVGQQEHNLLVYQDGLSRKGLEYNTMRIPYGKRFEIRLSDGTTVHLNAGSTLKFPVRFSERSKTREVFVTGEAYFEVAHNTEQPFVVNAGELNIRVLGTKFNISTYPEDKATDVVLVEGLVQLETENSSESTFRQQLLKPGFKASFDKGDRTITSQAVSTSVYTSWISGELVFRNMPFEDILKKLERKYDVSIRNNNKEIAKELFNASFGDESLETVLNYLGTIYGIDFSIEEDLVIIN